MIYFFVWIPYAYKQLIDIYNEMQWTPPEPESPPEPVTIKNIHNYMHCSIDTRFATNANGTIAMWITWNEDDEEICKIANDEFRLHIGEDEQKNLMWVEKLKEFANWKEGEYIYAFTKTNVDGNYWIHYKKDKTGFDWYNTIVDKKGFVAMKVNNMYCYGDDDDIKFSNFYRPWSVYNNMIADKANK